MNISPLARLFFALLYSDSLKHEQLDRENDILE